jgi:hypothetical protein
MRTRKRAKPGKMARAERFSLVADAKPKARAKQE